MGVTLIYTRPHPCCLSVRPCRMSYDTSTVLSARVKPKQKKVEVTMALNTQCTNFDTSKAKQIALNVDGSDAAERSHQVWSLT